MIEILRASFLVDADRLQRRRLSASDTDLAPGRRDAKLADPRQCFLVGDRSTGGVLIAEAAVFAPDAANAMEVESPPPRRFSGHAATAFCENGAGDAAGVVAIARTLSRAAGAA